MPPDPYYEADGVTIYCADNAEVLPHLSNVGLVVTSPPYNLGMGLDDVPVEAMHDRRSRSRSGAAANRLTSGYDSIDDAMPQREYVAWQRAVLRLCWAALRPDGAIYYNHKPRSQAGLYRTPLDIVPPDLLPARQVIIWDRVEKSQSYTQNAYVASCEWVVLLAQPGFRLKSRQASAASDVWRFHPERDGYGHPCPFPLALPRRILDTAVCGGSVLDPFMGAGTTLRAAVDAGLPAIGIERSERYCEAAVRRLHQTALSLGATDAP